MPFYRNALVIFRRDLRLHDNPALHAASRNARHVVHAYFWAPNENAPWSPGAANRWYLHHSLKALSESLEEAGSELTIRTAETLAAGVERIVQDCSIDAVYWNASITPTEMEAEAGLLSILKTRSIPAHTFASSLLHDPDAIRTSAGKPYRVFTAFWNKFVQTIEVSDPLPAPPPKPRRTNYIELKGASIESLNLLPSIPWDKGLVQNWQPGESAARRALDAFRNTKVAGYAIDRDRPDRPGTSRLSPRLHFGELSPRQIWSAITSTEEHPDSEGSRSFLRQLIWREFAHHVMAHFPLTAEAPLNDRFSAFPWIENTRLLEAWQRGRTGYPLVDAGMRELWNTGWMHNRVRMVVASFLTKHLLVHWSHGASWFWDTLVDADLASNTLGWQWAAGCGADAQPYFRIFNPVTQAQRFDPNGTYVRQWVPELRACSTPDLFAPCESTVERSHELDYPAPIVGHRFARENALAAYNRFKNRV